MNTGSRPRILFCCQYILDPRVGVPKHYIELAEALRGIGWETRLAGTEEICGRVGVRPTAEEFGPLLREFIRSNGEGFDVVEYDHGLLPYPRTDFPTGPLMVARAMLLIHHLAWAPIPPLPRLRSRVSHLIFGGRRRRQIRKFISHAQETVRQADLAVVCTEQDVQYLSKQGIPAGKVGVSPPGMSAARRPLFDAIPAAVPSGPPTVAFVGTFDPRKGLREFPEIVERVCRRLPEVRFKLLGTAGMLPTAEAVLSYFPARLRRRLDVRPRYAPEELPGLLADCWAGVFPSAVEGFPYGVLEMQAAAVPVVAYDTYGPSAMLPSTLLVPLRDAKAMAERLAELLSDPARLSAERPAARERTRDFGWDAIARRTDAFYRAALAARRAVPAAG